MANNSQMTAAQRAEKQREANLDCATALIARLSDVPVPEAQGLARKMPEDQISALISAADDAAARGILGLAEPAGEAPPPTIPLRSEPAAKKPGKREEPQARKATVKAGPCAKTKTHENTRVYKTAGAIRFCVCDVCGHTWKRVVSEPVAVA